MRNLKTGLVVCLLLLVGIMGNLRADTIAWKPNITIKHSFGCESPFIIESITSKKTPQNNITITKTGEGTASGTVEIKFGAPGETEIKVNYGLPEGYTWPEGTNPVSEIPPAYDLFEDMAVQVKLIAVPNGDEPGPVISPKVCINAQPEHKKATWKATVLPTGTTASLEVLSGDITAEPLSQIKNDTKIKITGNGTGTYKIKLKHDSLPSCYTEEESVVFEFKYKKLQPPWEGEADGADNYLTAYSQAKKVGAMALKRELAFMGAASIKSDGGVIGKIVTNPKGEWEGDVTANIIVNSRQKGYLDCWGIIGIKNGSYFALSTTSLKWTGAIELSGAVNVDISQPFNCSAPVGLVWPRKTTNIEKIYKFTGPKRIEVEKKLKTKAIVKLDGTGGGALVGWGCSALTTLTPGIIYMRPNPLYINPVSHPAFSDYVIVE